MPVWQSNSTSHSHPGQGWHEGGWKGGGESNEKYYADRWDEDSDYGDEDDDDWEEDVDECQECRRWQRVESVTNEHLCFDNHVDNIHFRS